MTPDDLLAFEEGIAKLFAEGVIASPIHLAGGNERELIDIFQDVQPHDWVLCGWRSHYHCLLKGVSPMELTAAILDGRSVSLCFPKHKILSSGIVGGIAPIAVGIAWAVKRRNDESPMPVNETVWVFLGDMTAQSGIVHECMKYAAGHGLPVRWVIEDNRKSVCTDTQKSWGSGATSPDVTSYSYEMSRPHSGIGKWVRF